LRIAADFRSANRNDSKPQRTQLNRKQELKVNPVWKLLDDGGFVAGDKDSRMTSYAYPSSPHANVAKRYPKLVAEEMLDSERLYLRKVPAIQDYDFKNWLLIGENAHHEQT
jgi:hypothetical protein